LKRHKAEVDALESRRLAFEKVDWGGDFFSKHNDCRIQSLNRKLAALSW